MNCNIDDLIGKKINKIVASDIYKGKVCQVKIYTKNNIFIINYDAYGKYSYWFESNDFDKIFKNFQVINIFNDFNDNNKRKFCCNKIIRFVNENNEEIKLSVKTDGYQFYGKIMMWNKFIYSDFLVNLTFFDNIIGKNIKSIETFTIQNCIVEIKLNLDDKTICMEIPVPFYDNIFRSCFYSEENLTLVKNFTIVDYCFKRIDCDMFNQCKVMLKNDQGKIIKFWIRWVIDCENILLVRHC